ncbi:KH domain-containing protein [bacterium]|nr:KH domain-containing protein [candidate division CSSED10-310 bacterium]
MRDLVLFIAQALIDNPENVHVKEIEGNQTTVIELKVHPDDIGKVIGRQGRTANAIRTIVNAAALKAGKRVILEIIESQTESER